jgi:hypothetical protein
LLAVGRVAAPTVTQHTEGRISDVITFLTRHTSHVTHAQSTEGQLLKLPANKFTVREREMLMGSGILPREFFEATQNPFVIGVGARECAAVACGCVVLCRVVLWRSVVLLRGAGCWLLACCYGMCRRGALVELHTHTSRAACHVSHAPLGPHTTRSLVTCITHITQTHTSDDGVRLCAGVAALLRRRQGD